jgi:hypothetical protein
MFFGFGFGSGGFRPMLGSGIQDISFKSSSTPTTANAAARPAPPPPVLIPAEDWLIGAAKTKLKTYAEAKLNPKDSAIADLPSITRPIGNASVLPLATAHGASDSYAFSPTQIDATKKLYRWHWNNNLQYPLYSFETDRKTAGFQHDWYLQSKTPVAIVYSSSVKDSVAVLRYHSPSGPSYCYVRQDDADRRAWFDKNKWTMECVEFYMPIHGPFSVIPHGSSFTRPMTIRTGPRFINGKCNMATKSLAPISIFGFC